MKTLFGIITGSVIFCVGGYFVERLLFFILQIDFINNILTVFTIVWILVLISTVLAVWGMAYSLANNIAALISDKPATIVILNIVSVLFMAYMIYGTYISMGLNVVIIDYVIMAIWAVAIIIIAVKDNEKTAEE